MADYIPKDVFNWLQQTADSLLNNNAASVSLTVEDFVDQYEEHWNSLKDHIEDHKNTNLSVSQPILEHAFQLAAGICSTDLNTFTSLDQEGFAARLKDEFCSDVDPRVADIIESIGNSEMKIMSDIRSSRVNLLRFGEEKECICPTQNNHVNSVCLSRVAMHFIRAVMKFYNMTKGTQKVFRQGGVTSLDHYRKEMDRCLERLLDLACKEISPECLVLKAERSSSRSAARRRDDDPRQRKIDSYFSTPPATQLKTGQQVVAAGTETPEEVDLSDESSDED